MNFQKAPVYLITDENQRLFLTGFHSTAGYVVLTEDEMVFVVDNRYYYAAKARLCSKGIKVVSGSDYTTLKECLQKTGAKALGIDFSLTTVKQYNTLKEICPELVDVSEEMQMQMAVKTEEELSYIKKACQIAEKAFKQTMAVVKEGMTERELATELEYRFKLLGASGKSFDTIVGFGENSAVPHHETGEKKLKMNVPVLMDFGCKYKGYCSDMTRTFWFGDKPSKEFTKAYGAVYAAHMKCYEDSRAGMTGVEIDGIARQVLEEGGYGKLFTHSLGHGIGVNIHEYPWVSPKGQNKVEENMVFSIEPGVYKGGKFGIRIEDTCAMKDGRPYSYMTVPKELSVHVGGKLRKYAVKK